MSDKLKVGISIGDVNGIGLEVIIKTLLDNRILEYCTPIVYGHTKVSSFHRKALNINDFSFNVINHAADANEKRSNLINCWEEDVKIRSGYRNRGEICIFIAGACCKRFEEWRHRCAGYRTN
jgi:4-hydroxy-L-threonine phosphate dehydrogenase PdxA